MEPNTTQRPLTGPAAIRQARNLRRRMIRRRVAAGAVSLFMAAWLLIAFELVTGHDPALAARTARTVASTTTTTPGTTTTTTTTPSTTTSSSASQSSAASSGSVSSVSTGQS